VPDPLEKRGFGQQQEPFARLGDVPQCPIEKGIVYTALVLAP
jgi:hypothetical protein